jgi:hypothetical protein
VHLERLTQVQEHSLALLWMISEALQTDGVGAADFQSLNQESSVSHLAVHHETGGRVQDRHARAIHEGVVRTLNGTADGGGGDALREKQRARGQEPRDHGNNGDSLPVRHSTVEAGVPEEPMRYYIGDQFGESSELPPRFFTGGHRGRR